MSRPGQVDASTTRHCLAEVMCDVPEVIEVAAAGDHERGRGHAREVEREDNASRRHADRARPTTRARILRVSGPVEILLLRGPPRRFG